VPDEARIRFDDGAAYERYMGEWSRLAGEQFLDWLRPAPAQRWLDIGCGNGAFTAQIAARCAPAAVAGIDPSAGQLAFARARPAPCAAQLARADAMALPFADRSFDVAVMPLVIFFVPEPRRGVAEMARVVRPGGVVAAYAWDMPGGGFPYDALHAEMRALGVAVPAPPSPDASRIDALREAWIAAGLREVATCTFAAERTFVDFADWWATVAGGPSVGARLAAMGAADRARLEARMRERLDAAPDGRIRCSARANAVRGRRGEGADGARLA
jgi:SAM-dependent methyltransferase